MVDDNTTDAEGLHCFKKMWEKTSEYCNEKSGESIGKTSKSWFSGSI